ncbi:serine/arginine repetitive matrix protein 2-like [Huso huso]|uniref:Serine/arginine repetitive matrix protein 2-like n=1 Tax=Huso huso TaxID=61971 RepID=A0ABR0Y664_HUSHU
MYNGIGLVTPLPSRINSFWWDVQIGLPARGARQDARTDEELDKLESSLTRAPNPEILEHERKRGLELKCAQLQDMMEEQGSSGSLCRRSMKMFESLCVHVSLCLSGTLWRRSMRRLPPSG